MNLLTKNLSFYMYDMCLEECHLILDGIYQNIYKHGCFHECDSVVIKYIFMNHCELDERLRLNVVFSIRIIF